MADVGAVLLAAGAGKRLGRPKALVELDGRLLVDRCCDELADAGCIPVLVVLGAQEAVVRQQALLTRAVPVSNPAWAEGMSSSLSAGLTELRKHDVAAGVVAVVDQPSMTAEVVGRLIRSWRESGRSAVATYHGRPRNPVLLDSAVWPDVLAQLTGDEGARGWIRSHPAEVVSVACEDIAFEADIDTPDQLCALVASTGIAGNAGQTGPRR